MGKRIHRRAAAAILFWMHFVDARRAWSQVGVTRHTVLEIALQKPIFYLTHSILIITHFLSISRGEVQYPPHKIFHRNHFLNYLAHPPRIVSSVQWSFMVLPLVRSKGDQPHYVSNRRFRPGKWSAENCLRIEIGCAFFVTFFAQAKKVGCQ